MKKVKHVCHISSTDLSKYLKSVFEMNYDVKSIHKMHGGAQKVVYKIDCENGFKCVLYVWDDTMNYFQQEKSESDILDASSGADLFEINNKYFMQVGINTPKIYYLDKSKEKYPFDFAIVDYILGGDISEYFNIDFKEQHRVFNDLSATLRKMHSIKKSNYGNLKSNTPYSKKCETVIFEKSIQHLTHITSYIDSIAKNKSELTNILNDLYSNIKPRDEYGLIHGELGPNHVLVDENLVPYLIDIEGAMFFDIEYEHSFLKFRFGKHYNYMENNSLDKDRLLFYKMHLHISCVSGALKLLHRRFPHIDEVKGIIQYNSEETLKFLEY
jgi:hypothetical protein